MNTIPTPESITPEWLTQQLNINGIAGTVLSFTANRVGTGQIGMCIRYGLTYETSTPGAPLSLIGKFASDDPTSRATGVQLNNFIKEVSFYQSLQPRLNIRTPRCYFAQIEGEGPDFMLLLEDLAPAEQGDQLAGCGVDIAAAALTELVGLHAPSWCGETMLDIDWLGKPEPESAAMVAGLYQSVLPGFLDRFGHALEEDQRDIISRFGHSENMAQATLPNPFSLVHIDYRLDNLMIDQTISPPQVTVVDWQSITIGSPLTDVAYFIGAGMLPEARREAEADLVRHYHQALETAGVTGYDFEHCWQDYRRATFAGFPVTVIASMLVQQTERGDDMFAVMADRHSRHALDLNAGEFL